MNMNTMMTATTRNLHKAGFMLQKRSPEILLAVGVVSAIGSTVMACKSTTKASEVMKKTKEEVTLIHDCMENPELAAEYTKEDANKDLAITYTKCAVKVAKVYAPAIGMGILSLGCILASHNILRQRNLAFAAAYATVDKSFKQYRERVAEKFGDEVEKHLHYDMKATEITETIIDEETGEEKHIDKTVMVANTASEYMKVFDEANPYWEKDADFNLMFLRSQQTFANDKLRAQGYLFLNDVYKALGFPETRAGQIVGWLYNPKNEMGDNEVDFGMNHLDDQGVRDFINGYERSIWLDFNVDGPIIEKFEV